MYIWLISLDGSSHCVLYGFFTRDPLKKHDDLVGVVLLEPLAGQFIYFGDSLVLPGEIWTNPAGVTGRGRGR